MIKMLKAALIFMTLIYKVDTQFWTWMDEDDEEAVLDYLEDDLEDDLELPLDSENLPPFMDLPDYQGIRASEIKKNFFRPDRGLRPLPDLLSSMFFPLPLPPEPTPSSDLEERPVEMLCHLDRIYVRVLKSLFNCPNAWKHLNVGSCPVNQATDQHYYVLYPLDGCDGNREETRDRVIYSNTLYYEPRPKGLVIRELPFSVDLECHYNKHHRSYRLGFYPEVLDETIVFEQNSEASLTQVDEDWNPLPSVQTYAPGEAMYFEVTASRRKRGSRVYLNKCYITTSPDLLDTPRYTVLDNYGCMVDSMKSDQSRFYPSNEARTLRFSVGALLLKNVMSQPEWERIMYIHCEITLGPREPTPSAKSCTYDSDTNSWTELLGDDSVCACCDTSCPDSEFPGTMEILSDSLLLD